MEALNLKLEQYEGPLDLLLSLIQKHKIDIFDIPIAELTEQYLSYIAETESYNMELSSDFICMASELTYIKSKMLLPVVPEEDPRKELVDALLEYRKAKLAAEFLQNRADEFFDRFTKEPDETDGIYEKKHSVDLLTEAFKNLGKRINISPENRVELFEKLKKERHFTVEEKIFFTLRFLFDESRHEFSSLFNACRTIGEIVAVFLALLQLVRSGRVNVVREGTETYLILIKNLEDAG
ncbi:MAG: segregation/condensation protein A [Eubacteriales bacterium]|nr:segregation/condensation protein A [Eubacteriales bacterium]